MTEPLKHRMPDQVPGALRRFDDPWGITWRVANVFRRFDAAWLARFSGALLVPGHHHRPVFIIGMPRSGTTFLFHWLRRSDQLRALEREGHDIWRLYHHPRRSGWQSDHVGPGQVRRGERRVINAVFTAYAGRQRFLEKTADNCVRWPYLRELFPDALFVVITRNPCDVVNSYINTWQHPEGRFRSYFVPDRLDIVDYPHRHQWCSTLIEGWRDLARGGTIPEIAFAQWQQYVTSIAAARHATAPDQWFECHLEDLLTDPEHTSRRIYGALGIRDTPELASTLADLLRNPVNAMTVPRAEKWRSEHCDAVGALLPRLAEACRAIGYRIDPASGDCAIERPA